MAIPKERPLYQERIVRDSEVLVGKPVIKGTRIPVELVLAKLAQNPELDELLTDYPRLTREDVKACLEYAQVLVHHKRRPKARGSEQNTPQSTTG